MQPPPLPVRIIVLLIVLGTIAYFALGGSLDRNTDTSLNASGTIESVTVNISPELAGRVQEVLVVEGQSVQMGAPLLSLDDSLLAAQRAVASAQVDSASAALKIAQAAYQTAGQQYNTALTSALAAEQVSRLAVWKDSKPAQFDLPVWYFSKAERVKAAQSDVDAKKSDLADALAELDDLSRRAGSSNFLAVEAALVQARLAFQNAQTVLDATNGASDSQDLRDAAQIILDDAELALEDAQTEYEDALTTDGATDVLEARARAVIAQELYDTALDNLRALQTGADSQPVMTAARTVEQAQAALDSAQTAVKTAEASLALIDVQLKKLTIYASIDGTILTRSVEPGEFVQPGATALTLANLNDLTITVYVPEDQYGNLSLGQSATVAVDSFPGETFEAEVVHIADQAEFTPRNVQTVEGRSATVYAIKLRVTDPEDKLKIGMPADVTFK